MFTKFDGRSDCGGVSSPKVRFRTPELWLGDYRRVSCCMRIEILVLRMDLRMEGVMKYLPQLSEGDGRGRRRVSIRCRPLGVSRKSNCGTATSATCTSTTTTSSFGVRSLAFLAASLNTSECSSFSVVMNDTEAATDQTMWVLHRDIYCCQLLGV